MEVSCVNLVSWSLGRDPTGPLCLLVGLCRHRIVKEASGPLILLFPSVAMEGLGFLDALNSAPVPGIKIKKKKKVLSPTAAKVSFVGRVHGHRLGPVVSGIEDCLLG